MYTILDEKVRLTEAVPLVSVPCLSALPKEAPRGIACGESPPLIPVGRTYVSLFLRIDVRESRPDALEACADQRLVLMPASK